MAEAWLEPLTQAECIALLRADVVGRIAFVDGDQPIVLPVNYHCVETTDGLVLALRTRPGNVIDVAPRAVAFEIDGIDRAHHRGWSVLVQGVLRRLDPATNDLEAFDSLPWISAERNSWLIIEPARIDGRRLQAATVEWAFHASAYL